MAAGRRSQVQLNLFPFMSVLIAMMGILMFFMIMIVSTRVIAPEDPPPTPLEGSVARGPVTADEGTDQRAPGEKPADGTPIDEKQHAELDAQLQRLKAQLSQRADECQQLEVECWKLRDSIAAVKAGADLRPPPAEGETGVSLGAPEKVRVVPDRGRAAQTKKTPIFVEIQADKFVVHPRKTEYPADELAEAGSGLRKFLDGVDRVRDREYLLMLIHPAGVSAYQKLRKCLLNNYSETITEEEPFGLGMKRILKITKTRIDVGYEPFRRDWLYLAEEQSGGAEGR